MQRVEGAVLLLLQVVAQAKIRSFDERSWTTVQLSDTHGLDPGAGRGEARRGQARAGVVWCVVW